MFGVGRRPSWPHLLKASPREDGYTPPANREALLKQYCRCVAVSDTHSQHWGMGTIPDGDVLLHAGDLSIYASEEEIRDFNTWLGSLPHKHKIVIAGNHDFLFDDKWCDVPSNGAFWATGAGTPMPDKAGRERLRKLLTNCTLINDQTVKIDGITIYGTSVQPPLIGHEWAFCEDDQGCTAAYRRIPEGVDVLLTHCPPFGHGDRTFNGQRLGSRPLLEACRRLKPQFHVFGHVHDGYGVTQENGITFINASTTTTLYHPWHAPIVFDVAIRR
eukprot:TRINITY_DN43472_c0_g1_i1.p1 TRINITY_DN43472_c0_g1~~TRINITY_DN43472_c0_g1_i1.p1  ORF type:complete len:273 (-),score=34.01 TRINITY_DN43472_c0_g1_i1:306-1124(-)